MFATPTAGPSSSAESVAIEALVFDYGMQNAIRLGAQALQGLGGKFHRLTRALDGRSEALLPGVVAAVERRVGDRQAPVRGAALAEVEAGAGCTAGAIFSL